MIPNPATTTTSSTHVPQASASVAGAATVSGAASTAGSPSAPQAASAGTAPGPQSAQSAPAPQAASAGTAPGPQSAQSAPAAPPPPPPPRQIFWEVARLAFALMTRLIQVLHPIQSYYLEQSRQAMRVCTELCRIMLTIRFAPERITNTQLRHLHRARHILQALFNYTLPTPLGPRTSPSATPANTPSPSPNTPSSSTPSSASSHAPASSPGNPQSAIFTQQSAISDTHTSHPSHNSQNPQSAIHNPQSSFSPYIPDAVTLSQALRAATLPPNCAGALVDDPGDALVKALQQLHAVYFSLYPQKSPSPSQSQSPSPSQFQSEIPNLQSSTCNPQSGNPQSAPSSTQSSSVHSVHPVHNVHLAHPPPP